MALILAPSFDDHTREQIENHIAEVHVRRMAAAIEYHQGKETKLQYESDKIQARIARQYELLRKELDALEKAENKVQDRLAGLIHLQNELGLTHDMIELHQTPGEKEDD
jgi:uncharacterized protein involved in exopolysaccharide biosynthesis